MQFKLSQLNEAYHWLCQQRKHFPPNADIWHFRRQYYSINSDLLDQINSGDYRFSPQQKIIKHDGKIIHLWGSQDVLVMKLIAIRLRALLPLSSRCTHIKGHGGLKQTVVEIQNSLSDYKFVFKTDVKGFYESINQYLLVEMINDTVLDADLRHYLYQIIHRCVEFGGDYRDIDQGISRGCPLSPILGALYLTAAFRTDRHIDIEYALQALRPSHGLVLLFWCFIFVSLSGTAFASFGRRHIDTFFAVWGEHAMEFGQVYSRLWNQGCQFRDKVQRLEDDMGRAITVRRFELIADIPRRRQ